MPEISAQEWEIFLRDVPEAHILQTGQWGELKSHFGWMAVQVLSNSSASGLNELVGAQILFRPLPLGFSVGYLPKGPLSPTRYGNDFFTKSRLWDEIDQACRKRRAVFIKVEPDIFESPAVGTATSAMSKYVPPKGFTASEHSIQPPRTLTIDISGGEDQILGRMKQKTRYNIRLAQKKGIAVAPSDDLDTFYQLVQTTGNRDRFPVHQQAYYNKAFELFHPSGQCELLMAKYENHPIACLMAFVRGSRAWYFYGGSADVHRELMPAYLLQWEAIRWARARGCSLYDLWGVPDQEIDILERQFANRSGGLWGVYRFKRGFGGELRRSIGPWDRVYQPLLYYMYRLRMQMASSRQEYGA